VTFAIWSSPVRLPLLDSARQQLAPLDHAVLIDSERLRVRHADSDAVQARARVVPVPVGEVTFAPADA